MNTVALLEDTSTTADATEVIQVSSAEAYERGKADLNFFAGLCMPAICRFPLPAFYIAVWQLFSSSDEATVSSLMRFALGLPRGHAKTTFIKLLICWLILYDKIHFALIVCSNSDLADLLLADIHDILSSPNITNVYGDWLAALAINSSDTKKAAYHRRSVTLVARGWQAGVRGINIQNERPDFIFCDDVQTRKNDESPAERETLLKELVGTIFKALAPTGPRWIIYVGNMYSEECILNKFKKSPSWVSMITGAILEDGTPLWPALFPISELKESYNHDAELGLKSLWFAEVMNDPKGASNSLLPNPLPPSNMEEPLIPSGAFITIDPAGFRKNSDDNVIAVHYVIDGVGYVVQTDTTYKNPADIIKRALELALSHGCSLIAVEDVGYQQTLGYWITHFITELGITGITVVPVSPHGRSKEARIRLFISALYAESYFIHDAATRARFTWQASMYKVGKKDNQDDLLDAIAYGEDVRNLYWNQIRTLTNAGHASGAKVQPFNTAF